MTHSLPSDLKSATLLAADMTMLATAASFDLQNPDERRRSALELSRFFFHVASVISPDLFIEAGAKEAGASRRARRLLDPKRIVAFEANPYTHKRFSAKYDNPAHGVEYLHLALSDSPGSVSFNVNLTHDGKPAADGQGSLLVHDNKPDGTTAVTVEATTLDTFFAAHEYTSAACWMDVEGALEGVLVGGQATLEKAGVVIIEVEDREYWGGQWLRHDVVSYLYDRGLVPIARDYQSRYQYNIVFVRASELDNSRVRWALAQHRSLCSTGRPGPEVGQPATTAADATLARRLRRTAGKVRRAVKQRTKR